MNDAHETKSSGSIVQTPQRMQIPLLLPFEEPRPPLAEERKSGLSEEAEYVLKRLVEMICQCGT